MDFLDDDQGPKKRGGPWCTHCRAQGHHVAYCRRAREEVLDGRFAQHLDDVRRNRNETTALAEGRRRSEGKQSRSRALRDETRAFLRKSRGPGRAPRGAEKAPAAENGLTA